MPSRKKKKSSKSNALLKKKIITPILIAFIFGSILSYVVIQPQVDSLKTNEDVLESQISFLEKQITELKIKESELSKSQTIVNDLQSQVTRIERILIGIAGGIIIGLCTLVFSLLNTPL